nr:hypothetical protein [uncultured bacterium]
MKRSVWRLTLMLVLISCWQAPETLSGEIALINGTLIDGTGNESGIDVVIVIHDDRIAAIGPQNTVKIPVNAHIIDVEDSTILPGFINAHVHDGYSEQNLQTWVQSGVTTVRDLAGVPQFELRNTLNADPHNARLVAVGPMVTTPGGYPGFGLTVKSPEDARQKVNELIDDGADLIKIPIEDDLQGRRWPMLSEEEIAAIVETAHARGLPVSAHISRAKHLKMAIEAGVDDVAHMIVDTLPDDLITRMIERDIYWEPTLELWQCVRHKHGVPWDKTAITNLRRFVAADGKVALGNDFAGYTCDFDSGMPMTEIMLMQRAGMTPMQIIVAATKHAAHVCNREQELGTLEPGKIADIIVVNGNPLENLDVLQDVSIVIHNGEVIRNN